MEGGRQSYFSMPLASRLDRLDFLMKYLERKQNLQTWDRNSLALGLERQCVPVDLAVKEADSKGSLLDRVAALEHRLFQLCLEKQSSNISSSSSLASTLTPGYTSSQGCKGEPSNSLPTFNNHIHGDRLISKVGFYRHEIQGKPHRVPKNLKHASLPKQHIGNSRPTNTKDEKACKSQKKGISPNWPRLKMLGC
ncbi:uncharacterized protein LOC126708489 [Quercus robur]|uniref:uncharacterized protein LOC126708489 n=1 Tax=Quercus robur TaxID=38942 RepID=UPI002161E148|nr:uncharacterized protein LOC126708489 [Quercus robur]